MPKSEDIKREAALCRDCAAPVEPAKACSACGSLRAVSHPELHGLSIAHVDCDAFYCSIEKRDNPELMNKPVIVGGGTRGVVSAACYTARVYGVHSAMPMYKALKACPHAVVIRGSMNKYSFEGKRIRNMMLALTPQVEPLSIDEAFIDLTGTQRLHGRSPAQSLIKLQNDISKEVGVTVSVGLSYNKFLAKTASDLDKPNGFAVLGKADAVEFLADKPVGFIFGVGPAFSRSLAKFGLFKISDVRKWSDAHMMKQFGESGLRLARLARAEDFRRINPTSERKSVSTETTFNTDITDIEELKDKLWLTCVKTADRAKAIDIAGRVVTLKLKTNYFESLTRRRTLPQPVQLADTIFRALEPLLEAEANGRKFRLIGAGISDLALPVGDSGDLLDPIAFKRGVAERASDAARAKFGKDAIIKGRALRSKSAKTPSKDTPKKKGPKGPK
ncbi:MAG: DNA polymerase IV [Alphaproteobacteria bacterium]